MQEGQIYRFRPWIPSAFKYNAKGHALTHKNEENVTSADEGITQLIGYRLAQNADEAFLLLYDMRQKDKDLTEINARCLKEEVLRRRYFIHNATARKGRAKQARQKP